MAQFGVTIPNNWGVPNPHDVLALGPEAERMGYHSIWVMDHLFNTGYILERLENRPYYHPMAMLSYLSAVTNRVTLGTSVLVLPYHHPVELAKYAATLDQMSGGRLILGVGVGAMTEEFDALGISMRQRGATTNESISLMRELWTSPNPQFHSPHWNFSDLYFYPKTPQPPLAPMDRRLLPPSPPPGSPARRRLAPHRPLPRTIRRRPPRNRAIGQPPRTPPIRNRNVRPHRSRSSRRPLQPTRRPPRPPPRRRPPRPPRRPASLRPRRRRTFHPSPKLRRHPRPAPPHAAHRRRNHPRFPLTDA